MTQPRLIKLLPEQQEAEEEKLKRWHGFELTMIKNYQFDEVASALQKSIRRGLEFDATYWAAVIYKSGYRGYLSRRLQVIANEDIGLGNSQALILANQLYLDEVNKQKDTERYKKTKSSSDDFLPLANLIILMCRGQKTRIADEITNIIFDGLDKSNLKLEIPEYAIDPHCDRGKDLYGEWESGTKEQSHRRIKLWIDVWSKLANEWKGTNPYRNVLKTLWGYFDVSKAPVKGGVLTGVNEIIAGLRDKEFRATKVKKKTVL